MSRERQEENEGISGGRFVQPEADAILPPTRDVRLETMAIDYNQAYHFGRMAVSPQSFSWGDCYMEWNDNGTWRRDTQIPVGSQVRVIANFTAKKMTGGTAWAMGITMIDPNYTSFKNWGSKGGAFAGDTIEGPCTLNKMSYNVMPDRDLNLRLKPWGNDDSTPSNPPDPEQW